MEEKELLNWTVEPNKRDRSWKNYAKIATPAITGIVGAAIMLALSAMGDQEFFNYAKVYLYLVILAAVIFLMSKLPFFRNAKIKYTIGNKGISKVFVYKHNAFRSIQQEKIDLAKGRKKRLWGEPGNQYYWPFEIIYGYNIEGNRITLFSHSGKKFEIRADNNLKKVTGLLDKYIKKPDSNDF